MSGPTCAASNGVRLVVEVPDDLYRNAQERASIHTGGDVGALLVLLLAQACDPVAFERMLMELSNKGVVSCGG